MSAWRIACVRENIAQGLGYAWAVPAVRSAGHGWTAALIDAFSAAIAHPQDALCCLHLTCYILDIAFVLDDEFAPNALGVAKTM